MIADDVRRLLEAAGDDADAVLWAPVSDQPPQAPSHQWVVWPTADDEVVLGGSDHGRFSAYARFGDPTLVAEILSRWLDPVLPPPPRDAETLHAASLAVADGIVGPDAAAPLEPGRFLPGSVVPAGAPLDHIGTASGHVLHLFDTAFDARSLPPTDANVARIGLVLTAPLPDSCSVVRVEPWFGQPGGGVSIVLDRVIAYYVDQGVLAPFAIDAEVPAAPDVRT
ncbi:Protein of unknown function [Nocardioides exalbidus]|uniref:TNT domain-containing protein n=1 Tax=Nocardioides exalbidus TaxID=402596 RepID=A0A1H4MGE1_9ACTN|nr:glycohydrolase toxin TNT-related protein [Nocardioides exalbidus]SEB81897.1 Protein of unknown function [Nocardioides exalbidus]